MKLEELEIVWHNSSTSLFNTFCKPLSTGPFSLQNLFYYLINLT